MNNKYISPFRCPKEATLTVSKSVMTGGMVKKIVEGRSMSRIEWEILKIVYERGILNRFCIEQLLKEQLPDMYQRDSYKKNIRKLKELSLLLTYSCSMDKDMDPIILYGVCNGVREYMNMLGNKSAYGEEKDITLERVMEIASANQFHNSFVKDYAFEEYICNYQDIIVKDYVYINHIYIKKRPAGNTYYLLLSIRDAESIDEKLQLALSYITNNSIPTEAVRTMLLTEKLEDIELLSEHIKQSGLTEKLGSIYITYDLLIKDSLKGNMIAWDKNINQKLSYVTMN